MHDELTAVDIKKMQEEIDYRKLVLAPQLKEALKHARELGDLSENFEYHAAKRDLNKNNSRIRYLQQMIATAVVISAESGDANTVGFSTKYAFTWKRTTRKWKLSLSPRSVRIPSRAISARNLRSARRLWARKQATECLLR